MNIEGWRYYNHAVLPSSAPNVEVNMEPLLNSTIWKIGGGTPLLARWTSDFDCGYETDWWYVIKDDFFDISSLKSKRRYEINKGKKSFCVKVINAKEHISDIIEIQRKAYEEYPEQYRPTVNPEKISREINEWTSKYIVFGGFSDNSDNLCGYAVLIEDQNYVNFAMLKVLPSCEKQGINAAIVAGILEYYNERLTSKFFICDGERALFHETNFQDYLEKYFGFRKAYCKLHIKFRFPMSMIMKLLALFPERCFKMKALSKVKVLLQYYRICQKV